jgi:rhamnosyltransferase
MTTAGASVCAVVVTHRPDLDRLRGVLARLHDQVDHVVVVDNGPDDVGSGLGPGVTVLQEPGNVGLAAAVNDGVAWARARASTHVLLLDQDSWPQAGMVATLLRASTELSRRHRVAAVGPRHVDPRLGRAAPFIEVGFPMSRKLSCVSGAVRCDFLIGSGTLIALPVLDDVGPMDAGLFIDNVDLDWCFRARARGYAVFGVGGATMEHLIGERRASVLGAQVAQHRPERLYFITRNRLKLYRRPHTPRVWVAQDAPRVLLKALIFGLLLGPRAENLRQMRRGFVDGVRDVSGPGPLAPRPMPTDDRVVVTTDVPVVHP